MSYKTITVHVNESSHCAERVKVAAAIAVKHEAHLVGVATSALPSSFFLPGFDAGAGEALASCLAFSKEAAVTALAAFEGFANQIGAVSIERRLVEDETGMALCLQARYSDLLVIGQRDPDEELVLQSPDVQAFVLKHSPCAVLFIPYAGAVKTTGSRVVIAWNGTIAAARAIAAALPLLKRASIVQVAVFNADADPLVHGEQPGADIALFLARHDVNVEVTQQTTDDGMDVGNALLSHVADFNADLLVMGGFGHSRLRETVLGGVTRTILESMTVPVLMAH